jgi:hypothetical protein
MLSAAAAAAAAWKVDGGWLPGIMAERSGRLLKFLLCILLLG